MFSSFFSFLCCSAFIFHLLIFVLCCLKTELDGKNKYKHSSSCERNLGISWWWRAICSKDELFFVIDTGRVAGPLKYWFRYHSFVSTIQVRAKSNFSGQKPSSFSERIWKNLLRGVYQLNISHSSNLPCFLHLQFTEIWKGVQSISNEEIVFCLTENTNISIISALWF